ncbi:MAG: hypothetical protein HQL14_06745 [Candidatus Omnitrophica bacterium]|nr:hypothetical protein [Candidatus Omnitrophota bacterium]
MITLLKPPSTDNYWKNGVMPYQVASLKGYLSRECDITIDDLEIKVWMFNRLNLNNGIDLSYYSYRNVLSHLLKKPDEMIEEYSRKIIRLINNLKNPVIAFYVENSEELLVVLTIGQILKKMGKSVVLVGAFFQTISCALMKKYDFIDYIVFDSGELSLEYLLKNKDPKAVPNLSYRLNKRVLLSQCSDIISQNLIPMPDFSGLPFDLYKKYNSQHFGFSSLVLPYRLSQGCGRDCFFCGLPKYNYFNVQKPVKAVSELKALTKKYKTSKVFFYDNSITFSNSYLKLFCDQILKNKLKIRYVAFAHYSDLKPNDLLKLRKTGCLALCFGVESVSVPSIVNLKKNKNLHTISDVLKNCKKAGVWTHIFVMCGLFDQTLGHLKKDLLFIKKNIENIDSILINQFQLLIGSDIYKNPGRYGINKVSYTLAPYSRSLPFLPVNRKATSQYNYYFKAIGRLRIPNFEPDRCLSFLFNESRKGLMIDLMKKRPVLGSEGFLKLCREAHEQDRT